MYAAVIDDCRANVAFDPTTMGSVPNVGRMAQAAEEYGSHDKTFEIPADGTVRVVNCAGEAVIEHAVNELDNRGSHFYLAMYWAQELAEQTDDPALAAKFTAIAEALTVNEAVIVDELNAVPGSPVDIGGYYYPDPDLVTAAMRPSATFNGIIDAI